MSGYNKTPNEFVVALGVAIFILVVGIITYFTLHHNAPTNNALTTTIPKTEAQPATATPAPSTSTSNSIDVKPTNNATNPAENKPATAPNNTTNTYPENKPPANTTGN